LTLANQRNQLILSTQVSYRNYTQERGCYERLPDGHNHSGGNDDPVVCRPGRTLPTRDLSHFTIAKEVAILQLVFMLITRSMANYKAGQDGSEIANSHRGPKETQSEAKHLDIGTEEMVAPTLGAKHGHRCNYRSDLCVMARVSRLTIKRLCH
jgi:hypothetical protein